MATATADPVDAATPQKPKPPSEKKLDHAIEETFPASDPISASIEPPAKSLATEAREEKEKARAERARMTDRVGQP